ncbi:Fe-S-containing hydro-lyase [Oleidesulfovibrio sp.]|uniref:Fe-S-containing hydro-lyase n=1 Tax=Oleidesulfovibrio sp. TaxID=2909707 RepID=UPI003A8BDC10
MATYYLNTPLRDEDMVQLKAGDVVFLNGEIYTARDAAHKRMMDTLDKGEKLPFEAQGSVVYYVGPTPAPPGRPIGSAGPTTSGRVDVYTPRMHSLGVKASIGKGKRNQDVVEALKKYKAVYFGATGGAGALLSQCITASEVVAYEELGPEAIRRLTVKDFPLLVINDCHGGELYVKPALDR